MTPNTRTTGKNRAVEKPSPTNDFHMHQVMLPSKCKPAWLTLDREFSSAVTLSTLDGFSLSSEHVVNHT